MYTKEKNFMKGLCAEYVNELIEKVGWSDIQKEMVTKKFLQFKSVGDICEELNISDSTYTRYSDNMYKKLQTYLDKHTDSPIYKYY